MFVRHLMNSSGPLVFHVAANLAQLSLTASFCLSVRPVAGSGVSLIVDYVSVIKNNLIRNISYIVSQIISIK